MRAWAVAAVVVGLLAVGALGADNDAGDPIKADGKFFSVEISEPCCSGEDVGQLWHPLQCPNGQSQQTCSWHCCSAWTSNASSSDCYSALLFEHVQHNYQLPASKQ